MRGCPLFSASHPLSVGPIRFSLSPFLCMPLLAYRSYSGGTAEVATKTVTSWSNVLDAPDEDDAAKRFGLDAAAAERAGLRGENDEGIACPPWWLPPFIANHGQVHGKPHHDLMSHQSAEQPKPAGSPSHGEAIGLWTSSALLCAFVFLLKVYDFNGKVTNSFRPPRSMHTSPCRAFTPAVTLPLIHQYFFLCCSH